MCRSRSPADWRPSACYSLSAGSQGAGRGDEGGKCLYVPCMLSAALFHIPGKPAAHFRCPRCRLTLLRPTSRHERLLSGTGVLWTRVSGSATHALEVLPRHAIAARCCPPAARRARPPARRPLCAACAAVPAWLRPPRTLAGSVAASQQPAAGAHASPTWCVPPAVRPAGRRRAAAKR
jgi:hypothetical protein